MPKTCVTLAFTALVVAVATAQQFAPVRDWPTLPEGRAQMGNMHGDVAVSASGDIYVSVQDPEAPVQVYAPDGRFLRVLANAPADLHGFVIRRQADGEFLYGVSLRGQIVVKMSLDGEVVLTIPASAFPDGYKVRNARSNQLALLLSGMDVAPNGDLYVTDGYASDYVHRFDRTGRYLSSFGGKEPPYAFNTLHKIAIDTRFEPARILGADRANNRVVHLSLDGAFLGVVADDLRLPAAIATHGDHAYVGELGGRVSVLDRTGAVISRLGENTGEGVGSNQLPPDRWQPGLLVSPHGVALNERGDLYVAEFSVFGRVHRFDRR